MARDLCNHRISTGAGQSQRDSKFEKYSTFNETLTWPVSPVDG